MVPLGRDLLGAVGRAVSVFAPRCLKATKPRPAQRDLALPAIRGCRSRPPTRSRRVVTRPAPRRRRRWPSPLVRRRAARALVADESPALAGTRWLPPRLGPAARAAPPAVHVGARRQRARRE